MTRELFRAERLPVLQNRTFASATAARESPTGDVVLVQDESTGLVFNSAFDPSLLRYDRDYQNEQACSPVFQRHLDEVARIVARNFKCRRLVEIGCGKGHFLEHLRGMGYDVTGIDPAYEGDDPAVIKASFEAGSKLSADGIVLRHVLEHVPDPLGFLSDISRGNRGQGLIYIEVPCFGWILEHRAWFDIFYEHVNYFRLLDLRRIFGRVHESGHVFGGQYLYAVVDSASLRRPRASAHDHVTMPEDFLSGVERTASIIRNSGARRNAVWGAASKGVIFSIYMLRAGLVLDEAIDMNPAKRGRFLACSGLLVSSPEEAFRRLDPADNIFVMNSNYLDEIIAQSDGKFTYFAVDHE